MSEPHIPELWAYPGRSLETLTEADLDACIDAWESVEAQLAYRRQEENARARLHGPTDREQLRLDASEA